MGDAGRFAVDPTPAQEWGLASHCGASRFAYNSTGGVALVRERPERRERVREAGYRELLSDVEVEAPRVLRRDRQAAADALPRRHVWVLVAVHV
ncbi:MAG: helix-turn-helix domain-containing protein [Actinomycetota bacterium]|nr:helix-turn-helix domain-containing protein [Actinomycetota bacterium]